MKPPDSTTALREAFAYAKRQSTLKTVKEANKKVREIMTKLNNSVSEGEDYPVTTEISNMITYSIWINGLRRIDLINQHLDKMFDLFEYLHTQKVLFRTKVDLFGDLETSLYDMLTAINDYYEAIK